MCCVSTRFAAHLAFQFGGETLLGRVRLAGLGGRVGARAGGGFDGGDGRSPAEPLAAPVLLLPSVQVNIRAGHLPPAEDNGVHYLKLPLRLPDGADWA